MNRPVGVCITQNSRNPRIASAYKLRAFYYFYIVVLSVCVSKKRRRKKKRKKVQIINRKYIMTNIHKRQIIRSIKRLAHIPYYHVLLYRCPSTKEASPHPLLSCPAIQMSFH
jgi:hypothetical protein